MPSAGALVAKVSHTETLSQPRVAANQLRNGAESCSGQSGSPDSCNEAGSERVLFLKEPRRVHDRGSRPRVGEHNRDGGFHDPHTVGITKAWFAVSPFGG